MFPNHKTLKSRIIKASLLSGSFFLITCFYTEIDIFFHDLNYLISTLFVFLLFLIIFVLLIKNAIIIIKNKEKKNWTLYLPVTIYMVTILLSFLLPKPDFFDSKTVIFGYHQGTQNQATINFREDNSFQLHESAVFGYNEWFTGTYIKRRDSIILHYKNYKPESFGEIFLINHDTLSPLNQPKSSIKSFMSFKILPVTKNNN